MSESPKSPLDPSPTSSPRHMKPGVLIVFDAMCSFTDQRVPGAEEPEVAEVPVAVTVNEAAHSGGPQSVGIVLFSDNGDIVMAATLDPAKITALVAPQLGSLSCKVYSDIGLPFGQCRFGSENFFYGFLLSLLACSCKCTGGAAAFVLSTNHSEVRMKRKVIGGDTVAFAVRAVTRYTSASLQTIPPAAPWQTQDVSIECQDTSAQPLQALLREAYEGESLVLAAEAAVAHQQWPWLSLIEVGAEKGTVVGICGTVQQVLDHDPKSAIKRRLERQGARIGAGALMAELDPAKNTSFGSRASAMAPVEIATSASLPRHEDEQQTAADPPTTAQQKQQPPLPPHVEKKLEQQRAQQQRAQQQRAQQQVEAQEPEEAPSPEPRQQGGSWEEEEARAAAKRERKRKKAEAKAAMEAAAEKDLPTPVVVDVENEGSPPQVGVVDYERLERKRQKLLNLEQRLQSQQEEIEKQQRDMAQRAKDLDYRTASLTANEAGIRQIAAQLEAERTNFKREALVRRSKQREPSEQTGLLVSPQRGDAGFSFRVEQPFFDNTTLPLEAFENYTAAAWLLYIMSKTPVAGFVIFVLVVAIVLVCFNLEVWWPVAGFLVLTGVLYCSFLSRVRSFFDQLHLICTGTAQERDAERLFAHPVVFTLLFTLTCVLGLGSFILLFVTEIDMLPRIGMVVGFFVSSPIHGAHVALLTMTAFCCYERVAQTVSPEPGELVSKVSMRAALARYQYFKSLVLETSKKWTDHTCGLLAVLGVVLVFSVYQATLRHPLTTQRMLVGVCLFCFASLVAWFVLNAITGWEKATYQVVGVVTTHCDRWVRGDHNAASVDCDMSLADFNAMQESLLAAVKGNNYSRWGLYLPMVRGSVVIPVTWFYLISVLAFISAVMIPIVATYHFAS